MSSYRQILYHVVFRTKNGKKTLNNENSRELYAYLFGIIKHKNGFVFRINGMEDHIHILCDLHPNNSLADFMRDLKVSASHWLKQSGKFLEFEGWAEGYAAFTCSIFDKDRIINYIKNQQKHHQKESYETELRRLLREHEIDIDERFFP